MKILLVEDISEVRVATQELLESLGHEVVTAATGGQALRTLENQTPAFEALVTDLRLPGMSGTQILLHLLARDTDLALVAYSASRGDPILQNLVEQGRVLFLRKPFSAEDLANRLAAARLARDLPVNLPESGPPGTSDPYTSPRRWHRSWLTAAAFIAVISGASWHFISRAPGLPQPPTSSARRGTILEGHAPKGSLEDLPTAFRWQEVSEASSYRVELRGVDKTPLWDGVTSRADLPMLDEPLSLLHRGVVYSWKVEALDTEERVVAASEWIRFLVKPANTAVSGNSGYGVAGIGQTRY